MSELNSGLASAQRSLRSAGQQFGQAGRAMTGLVTLPIVGIGAAAFKASDDVAKAMASIRTGTGATGKALAGLGDDFRAVLGSIPASAADVGTAIAELNTRTGQTGEGLQKLAAISLELARVQGTDLSTTIETTTRLFGDWGVATDDQEAALDRLFRVSQATGPSVENLSRLMVQFGAPLRQMGFSIEEAAVVLGKFEKEGVNTELVMGSLRIALGKLARAGVEDVPAAFREMVKAIEEAGSVGEANALALELFGARAGPDMAAAIREGRFSIEELMASVEGSSDTIRTAGEEARTFGDIWLMARGKITKALEPLGEPLQKLLKDLTPHLEKLIGFVAKVAEVFAGLDPRLQAVIIAGAALLAALGPLLMAIGLILPAVAALLPVFGALAAVLGSPLLVPIAAVVAAIAGLTAGLVIAWQHSETFREIVTGALMAVQEIGSAAIRGLADFIGPIWNEILETVRPVLEEVQALWEKFGDDLLAFGEKFLGTLVNVFRTQWDIIAAVVTGVMDILKNVILLGLNIIQGDWSGAWENIKAIVAAARDAVIGIVVAMWDGIKRAFSEQIAAITGKVTEFTDKVTGAFNKMKNVIVSRSIVPEMWAEIGQVFSEGQEGVLGSLEIEEER